MLSCEVYTWHWAKEHPRSCWVHRGHSTSADLDTGWAQGPRTTHIHESVHATKSICPKVRPSLGYTRTPQTPRTRKVAVLSFLQPWWQAQS